MNDWFRSLTVLGLSFVSVVIVTMGLAMLIVSSAAQATDGTPRDVTLVTGPGVLVTVPPAVGGVPTQVGGTLAVSGDLQETFTLDREDTDGRYGLIGDDGRIFFGNDPLAVVQMNLGGLSFFPDPDECTITPGELNAAIGVAWATIHCADLADVRGNGVVSVDGTIGMAADLLGMRGDLPPSGGSIDIGGETLEFSEASLFVAARPAFVGMNRYSMQLVDDDSGTTLSFAWDPQTHGLALANVERDGADNDIPADACAIDTREVGMLNPRTTVVEMSLQCPDVDVPGLGPVPIVGSIIVEQIEIGF